jgi:hypothetical protein
MHQENINQLIATPSVVFTIDLDWACEDSIKYICSYFNKMNLPFTIFNTHHSEYIVKNMDALEVGIHPSFIIGSSHGNTITDIIEESIKVPHNTKVFRNHRYHDSNEMREGLYQNGFEFSSNICTHLEVLPPFHDRFNRLSFPIFFEDGGYLLNDETLDFNTSKVKEKLLLPGLKVVLIHPMHFSINTNNFNTMKSIKAKLSREEWRKLTQSKIEKLEIKGIGIRTFIKDMVDFILRNDIDSYSLNDVRKIVKSTS